MKQKDKIHDQYLEASIFRKRAMIAALFCAALFSIIVSRLLFLQWSSHDYYSTRSENNRIQIQAVPPNRGLIYSRSGVVMAENVPNYRLEITPEQVANVPATITALKQYLDIDPKDINQFQQRLSGARSFQSIPFIFDLSFDEVAKLSAIKHRFPGVNITASSVRRYPFGSLASHAIGYVGRINDADLLERDKANYSGTDLIGKTGVERYHEDTLHGSVGFKHVEVNAQGRIIKTLNTTPPIAGRNLFLTIDIELQRAAETALQSYSGSIILIQPSTGDILAMVSKPGFDLNLFPKGISQKEFERLNQNTDHPLFNRAVSGLYPPGSTIKPIIALTGLESGLQTPKGQIFCPGFYLLPNDDRRYRDWKRTGHGLVRLDDAIIESCDILFYDLSLRLGIDRISPMLKRFGLGQVTGIDNTAEARGTLPSREWKKKMRGKPWYPGETLITGIGQGYMTMTPVQLANMAATLANRGIRYQPKLLYATQEGGNLLELSQAVPIEAVRIKPDQMDYVIDAMKNTTQHVKGTAYRAFQSARYPVAGKTGTAQVFGIAQGEEYDSENLRRKLRDHALFIGFAPVKQPEVAIAVIAEHGESGGSVAAPIARKVLDAYFTSYLHKQ